MGKRRTSSANLMLGRIFGRIQRLRLPARIGLGVFTALALLVLLRVFIKRFYHFFIVSESIHAVGILVLIYKLITKKSCSGLSLKSQEVTAIYLAVRLYCAFSLQPEVHVIIDGLTLISTIWVIYMMRFKLKYTYNKDLDTLKLYYLIVPAAILAVLIHPGMRNYSISSILWAFAGYLEAIAVLPQLRLMQNAKMAEPFTAHYVFALGAARFVGFAHWIIMIFETRGQYLFFWGYGSIWMMVNLLAEIVQTFILADFCYYYVKRVMAGQLSVLPLPV